MRAADTRGTEFYTTPGQRTSGSQSELHIPGTSVCLATASGDFFCTGMLQAAFLHMLPLSGEFQYCTFYSDQLRSEIRGSWRNIRGCSPSSHPLGPPLH